MNAETREELNVLIENGAKLLGVISHPPMDSKHRNQLVQAVTSLQRKPANTRTQVEVFQGDFYKALLDMDSGPGARDSFLQLIATTAVFLAKSENQAPSLKILTGDPVLPDDTAREMITRLESEVRVRDGKLEELLKRSITAEQLVQSAQDRTYQLTREIEGLTKEKAKAFESNRPTSSVGVISTEEAVKAALQQHRECLKEGVDYLSTLLSSAHEGLNKPGVDVLALAGLELASIKLPDLLLA